MSYDVYWVKNRAEKIADFEHPTLLGTIFRWRCRAYPQLRCFAACSGFRMVGPAPRNPQLKLNLLVVRGCVATARRHSLLCLCSLLIYNFML